MQHNHYKSIRHVGIIFMTIAIQVRPICCFHMIGIAKKSYERSTHHHMIDPKRYKMIKKYDITNAAQPSHCITQLNIKISKYERTLLYSTNNVPIHEIRFMMKYILLLIQNHKSFLKAASSLIISSILGIVSDIKLRKWIGSGNGILVTLVSASIIANIKLFSTPSNHFLYDICWTKFLPMSLAFLLLANDTNDNNDTNISTTETIETKNNKFEAITKSSPFLSSSILKQIQSLCIPFVIGCIGSILGCACSFFVFASKPKKKFILSNTSSWIHRQTKNLSNTNAALAAGCLCSSYIGGSINFFTTAKLLQKDFSNDEKSAALFSAMAASDVMVMAIYFAFLSWCVSSKTMWTIFPKTWTKKKRYPFKLRSKTMFMESVNSMTSRSIENQNDSSKHSLQDQQINIKTKINSKYIVAKIRNHIMTNSIIMLSIAYTIVSISNKFEKRIENIVPGTSCAFIALFSTILNHFLLRHDMTYNPQNPFVFLNIKQKQMIHNTISPFFSSICLHLLFASIGMNVKISIILSQGVTAFLFATFALVIHVTFLFGLSFIFNNTQILPKTISLDEMAVASNAAIGGPATAAAFAGTINERRDIYIVNNQTLQDDTTKGLVLSATVWGVIGYSLGTTIGISLGRFLKVSFC